MHQTLALVIHQDFSTTAFSMSSTGLTCRISMLTEFLSRDVKGREDTLHIATLVGQQESTTWAKPIVDLNLALRASLVVSKSVLSHRNSPELEAALNQVLKEYEGHLQSTEFWLSNKIVELVKKRETLRKRLVTTLGMKLKIKNWFIGVGVGIRSLQISYRSREYDSKRHLRRVARRYDQATNRTISQYVGWYNYQVPRISLGIVKNELLPVQQVATNIESDEDSIRKLLLKGNYSSYCIRNRELVKRSEFNEVLNRFTLNNVREYQF
jgi:hypothetical protein